MRTIDDLIPQEDALLNAIAAIENPCETGSKEWLLWTVGVFGGYLDTPLPSDLSPDEEMMLDGWCRGRRLRDFVLSASNENLSLC